MSLTTLDARTALVAIDLQQAIVAMPTQPYPGPEVVARTAELADAFRSHGLPVVLVRVSFATDGADAVPGRTERQARGLAFPDGWDSSSTNCPDTPATSASPSTTGAPSTAPTWTSSCAAGASRRSC